MTHTKCTDTQNKKHLPLFHNVTCPATARCILLKSGTVHNWTITSLTVIYLIAIFTIKLFTVLTETDMAPTMITCKTNALLACIASESHQSIICPSFLPLHQSVITISPNPTNLFFTSCIVYCACSHFRTFKPAPLQCLIKSS